MLCSTKQKKPSPPLSLFSHYKCKFFHNNHNLKNRVCVCCISFIHAEFRKTFWGQKKIEISSISFVLKQPLIHAVGRSRWAHNNDNATKKPHACYFWYWCRHMLLWLKTEPDKEVTFLSSLILFFWSPKYGFGCWCLISV